MANDINNGLNIISGVINQSYSGQTRLLTPAGGALVREYTDITNAATIGGIEIGWTYNCAINTTTGAWLGRDVADICWVEKWSDIGGLKQLWYAPTAAAGVVPTWQVADEKDLVNMSSLIRKTMTKTVSNGTVEPITYTNLASYSTATPTITGTLVINLGIAPSNNMGTYIIRGYDYTARAAWRISVSGYNYTTGPTWINCGYTLEGNPPFDFTQVRVGQDAAGKGVILLGATTTAWAYPVVTFEEALVGFANVTALKTATQSISFITSETGYTGLVIVPNLQSTLYQRFSGITAIKTPTGGAAVYEYADIVNAATVGAIEVGTAYNASINPTTGVWNGRDVADICWLEKWSDIGGLKEIWYAPTAAAGVAPAWVKTSSFNATSGAMTILGSLSSSSISTVGTGNTISASETGYTWGGATNIGASINTGINSNAGALDLRRWTGTATIHHSTSFTQVVNAGIWEGAITFDAPTTNIPSTTPVIRWNNSAVTVLTPTFSAPTLVSTVATGTAPFAVTSTTPVANLSIGGSSSSAPRLTTIDSRTTDPAPETYSQGITSDFRSNAINGPVDGGTYHGVLTFRQWSAGSDWTGGGVRQVAFTDNHNLWVRGANANTTWSTWRQIPYVDNPSFSGAATFNGTGTGGTSFTISDTANTGAGVNLRMIGNGTTTPNKYTRVMNGNYEIINSAYTSVLLRLSDAGVLTVATVPTQVAGDNTGSIASTSFVTTAINNSAATTEFYADATGTADAITATYTVNNTTLIDGYRMSLGVVTTNATTTPTFAPTINTVAQTARVIVKFMNGAAVALAPGDLQGVADLRYDLPNLRWVLMNPSRNTTGSAVGGGSDNIFNLNGQVVTTSYTIPTGSNAMSAGPITINTGVTVTIPTGSVWTIVG